MRICQFLRCKLLSTVIRSALEPETDRSSQEAKQNVIELKEDDPDALEEVLRKLYDCELPAAETKTWRFWLQLMVVADKYLEPELAVCTFFALQVVGKKAEDPDEILDMVQSIKEQVGREERYYLFAEGLRKRNLNKLLKNPRYRELVTQNKTLMLSLMDEVEAPRDLEERHYNLCMRHKDRVFRFPETQLDACPWCSTDQTFRGNPSYRGVAYLPTTQ